MNRTENTNHTFVMNLTPADVAFYQAETAVAAAE